MTAVALRTDPKILEDYSFPAPSIPDEDVIKLYEKCGLTKVFLPNSKKTNVKNLLEGIGIKPLSKNQIYEWANFLPTRYTNSGSGFTNRSRTSYKYDVPPMEVVKLIEYCIENKLFDYLEIRTPESRGIAERRDEDVIRLELLRDPALFGWLDGKVYLLATWAEAKWLPGRWLRRISANFNYCRRFGGYFLAFGILTLLGLAAIGFDIYMGRFGALGFCEFAAAIFLSYPLFIVSGLWLFRDFAGNEMN